MRSITIRPLDLTRSSPAGGTEGSEADRPRTVIVPSTGWRLVDLGELWRARELLFFLAWRDVKVRYKQTALGAAWAILQPLLMMVVFTLVFGRMAKAPAGSLPYPLFAYAGLLPWTFFASAVTAAGNSVVGSERLITKIYFPRLAVPFSAVLASLVDLAVASGMLLGLMAWYRIAPGPGFLLLPVVVGLIGLAALGLGTLLSALNVAYRDVRYAIPFFVQLGLLATPTVYAQSDGLASGPDRFLLALNPMIPLVSGFRAALLGGSISPGPLAIASAVALALGLFGCLYFRKVEDSFADII